MACSLVGDPRFLFLDEPTTGLDPQAAPPGLGPDRAAQGRRAHHPAHHALHGRSRAALRPRGDHGPRPHHRARHPARADRLARRGAPGGVRRWPTTADRRRGRSAGSAGVRHARTDNGYPASGRRAAPRRPRPARELGAARPPADGACARTPPRSKMYLFRSPDGICAMTEDSRVPRREPAAGSAHARALPRVLARARGRLLDLRLPHAHGRRPGRRLPRPAAGRAQDRHRRAPRRKGETLSRALPEAARCSGRAPRPARRRPGLRTGTRRPRW